MARPKKENAEYFSHDADMRNHRKIRAIGNKFGLSGYGAWCILLEMLTEADYNRLPLNDEFDWILRTPDFYSITTEEVQEIIKFCLTLRLFDTEVTNNTQYFYSVNLRERLTGVYEKRKRLRDKYEEQKNLNLVSVAETTFFDGLMQIKDAEGIKIGEIMPKNGKKTLQINTPKKTVNIVPATETPISETETAVSVNFSEETPISAAENTQSKVKESKVKESKGKETKVSLKKIREEGLPLPSYFEDEEEKNISTLERLSRIQNDTPYLNEISQIKKIVPDELNILLRCFFASQVESAKVYTSDLDARKHFCSWLDATRSNHASFIEMQKRRESKQEQTEVETKNKDVSQKHIAFEQVNELLKTIKTRLSFIADRVYSTEFDVRSEIAGIKQNIIELSKLAELLPENYSQITKSIDYTNSRIKTFESEIGKYINPEVSKSKKSIDNISSMLANKFGKA